jgi:ribosomal protein S18 acetylase RimI-like enzyme
MTSSVSLRKWSVSVYTDDSPEFLGHVRILFKEYASSLGAAVRLREFMRELTELPGEYAAPRGALLLADVDGNAAGCVAVRALGDDECEMRRLWVRHPYRGKGVGRNLAVAAIAHAREQGYRVIKLHTAPWMGEAVELYRSLGFVVVPPYRETLIQGATFMELLLA